MTVAVAVASAAAARAGGDGAPLLTLDAAIALARDHNRDITAATLAARGAAEQVTAVERRFLPVAKVRAGGLYELTRDRFDLRQPISGDIQIGTSGVSVPVTIDNASYSLPQEPRGFVSAGLEQPLTQLYQLSLERELAQLEQELNEQRLQTSRRNVETDVKRTYFDILRLRDALAATEVSLAAYRSVDQVLAHELVAGAVLEAERLQAEARLAAAEQRALRFRNLLQTAKENLNQLLARPLDAPFRVEEGLRPPVGPQMTLAEARETARENRPELSEGRILVGQAERRVSLKEAEYLPELALVAGYTRTANVPFVAQNSGAVELLLEWEVFDWGRKKHEAGMARATSDRARAELRQLAAEIELAVGQSYRALEESQGLVGARERAQRAARENLRVAIERHAQHKVLTADLLEAQADFAEAEAGYQQALLGLWSAQARFEAVIGVSG